MLTEEPRATGVDADRPLRPTVDAAGEVSLRNADGAWDAVRIADDNVSVLGDRSNPLLARTAAEFDASNERTK